LVKVFAQRRDWKDAIMHYSRAVQFEPEYANAHLGLGAALQEIGDAHEAEQHLFEASRLFPLNPRVHYCLSALYRALGRESDANCEPALFRELKEDKDCSRHLDQQMHLSYPTEDADPERATKK
jgi:Flp pilus assembly protein TadD